MTKAPSAILLFAAGLGTRMAPLTNTLPKPMVKVAGRPLLDHARAFCDDLRVVVNTHYFAGQIEQHLRGSGASISHEKNRPLETGGGLKRAMAMLDSNPAFTMNTDAVWQGPSPINILQEAWGRQDMDALLLLVPRENAAGHTGSGDFDLKPSGQLTRGTDYVYSGAQIIRTDGLVNIKDEAFSMWRLWDDMLERGLMSGVVYPGKWCDVGQPESIPLAEAMLRGDLDV